MPTSIFLTRITYFGVTTYHLNSISELDSKLQNDASRNDSTHNDVETTNQWDEFKADCLESYKNRGYFIFHAISDNETIAVITAQ